MQHFSYYSLKDYNTFHIDVVSEDFFVFEAPDELASWLKSEARKSGKPTLVMGGGSNLLFTGDFPGSIIYPQFKGIEIIRKDDEEVLLKIGAGEEWDHCVEVAVNEGLAGIENLSLIPGHAGAVPVQNIGAYGVEVQEVLEYVEGVYLSDGKPFRLYSSECDFDYRYSIFKGPLKNKTVITNVVLRLQRKPVFQLKYGSVSNAVEALGPVNLENIRKAIIGIRESKLPSPDVLGNAGSFFKNPVIPQGRYNTLLAQWPHIPGYPLPDGQWVKVPAGWLIEAAGWKGKELGNAGVHQNQALVLVNRGGATGKEILQLAQAIETDIWQRFKIRLAREVNVL